MYTLNTFIWGLIAVGSVQPLLAPKASGKTWWRTEEINSSILRAHWLKHTGIGQEKNV